MNRCQQFQPQMLDFLYGLLDSGEAAALQDHLSQCPACASALERARRQQQLLAAAARKEFAGVRFVPPVASPAERPAVLPMRSGGGWLKWAVAAAILAALGIGIPGAAYQREQAQVAEARERCTQLAQQMAQVLTVPAPELTRARQELFAVQRDIEAKLAEPQQELWAVQQEIAKLQNDRQQKLAQIQREAAARPLSVMVTGPRNFEAGAQNSYQVQILNAAGQPTDAAVSAWVVDKDQNTLFKMNQTARAGAAQLTLPADLPVKLGSEPELIVAAQDSDRNSAEVREKLRLVAPVYLTHLATDKPMYQPGEVVHFRSLTLERSHLRPPQEDLRLIYTITTPGGQKQEIVTGLSRLTSEKGAVLGPDGQPVRGIGAGEYPIDFAAPGGEYTLTVREAGQRFMPQERKFLVNRYEKPQLNKELEFTRKSYGPGEEVMAACKATRVGQPAARAAVTATVQIDGRFFGPDGRPATGAITGMTDEQGRVAIRFRLPAQIERGQASLAVTFHDGGNVETIVRAIPVVLKKLQMEFYPEGGYLVAGVPNRVYFQVLTMLDRPAEVRGRVVDDRGRTVAQAQTLHDDQEAGINQGMGRFEFTPEAGRRYEFRIDVPAGIEGRFRLPEPETDRVGLMVLSEVTTGQEPIRVRLWSGQGDRSLLVGAYCRGQPMARAEVRARERRPTEVELQPEGSAGGVYRITVFEMQHGDRSRLIPRAERLVYRTPAEHLRLSVHPDHPRYTPGAPVKLRLESRDEKGEAAPAVAMVAVVDKSVLKLADEKTFHSMPTHFLLTSEVRRPEELEHADVLLGNHPKAAAALDLLLGTQGWRRFAEQEPERFKGEQGQEADRMLAAHGRSGPGGAPQRIDSVQQKTQQVDAEFQARVAPLMERLARLQSRAEVAQGLSAAVGNLTIGHEAWLRAAAPVAIGGKEVGIDEAVKQYAAQDPGFAPLKQRLDQARTELAQAEQTAGRARADQLNQQMQAARAELTAAEARLARFEEAVGWARDLVLPLLAGCLVVGAFAVILTRIAQQSWSNPLPRSVAVAGCVLTAGLVAIAGVSYWTAGRVPLPELAVQKGPAHAAPPQAGAPFGFARPTGRAPEQVAAAPLPAMPVPTDADTVLHEGLHQRAAPGVDEAAPQAAQQRLEVMRDNAAKAATPPGTAGIAPRGRAAMVKREEAPVFRGAPRRRAGADELQEDRKQAQLQLGRNAAGEGAAKKLDMVAKIAKDKTRVLQAKPFANPAPALMDQLRRQGEVRGGGRGRGGEAPGRADDNEQQQLLGAANLPAQPLLPPPPFVVREYAHRHVPAETGPRQDFAETLFWTPVLVLPGGTAEVAFDLCDSVTTFQVLVAAHTRDGRLGAITADLTSHLPLTVQPKLPVEISSTDRVDLPVTLANNTDAARAIHWQLQSTGLELLDGGTAGDLALGADQRTRRIYPLHPTLVEGQARLRLRAGAPGLPADTIERTLSVVADGFPVVGARSDMLEGSARLDDLVLPETWVPGTLHLQVTIFPSTLADLQKGLEGLLREPCGCFEQTSSTNYPNVLTLDYLRETSQARPEAARQAQELLARGYQRLTSFECDNPDSRRHEGYEWFGGAVPPHEALTAYGLMQFRDMARVYNVDPTMVERTRAYLMSRRDGQGGFLRNPRAIDTFGHAPQEVTNAYIVWALTESGPDDVTRELNALAQQAKSSRDPYFLALVANSLLNRDRRDEAQTLLKTLAQAQQKDGRLDGQSTSITGSGGRELQIETTALTVYGWLKAHRPDLFHQPIQSAVRWIGQQRGGYGGYGSTQSTILALKALVAYARANKESAHEGDLVLAVGGREVARTHFPAGVQEAVSIELTEPEKTLRPGRNEVHVEVTGKNVFPYTATWSYRTLKPTADAGCPVGLTTRLDRSTATEGETVRLSVRVDNRSGKGQGMTVAIVGLPAGLTVPEDLKDLKELTRLPADGSRPAISYFELRGRELVLYWRDLPPDAHPEVNLPLICRVPGVYRGPASRAYLYYNADHKAWVDPLAITIRAGTRLE